MTSCPPIIQLIHASDAPQHTGELKSILQRMKSEKRISDFSALDINTSPGNIALKSEDHQGVIVLLTNEFERVRAEIESLLKNVTQEKQNIKLIEIIVDNLPYHNAFISFPQDLMPIRSRVDMNLVWNGIEDDLKVIFPKPPDPPPEVEVVKKKDSIFLKVIAIAVMTGVLSIICVVFLSDNNYISDDTVSAFSAMIFSALLPIIIFARHRKDLEWFTLPAQGKKRIEGVVNWKQLLIASAVAFLVMFIAIWLFSFEFFESASILGVAAVLPFLLYRMESDEIHKVQDDASQIQSQTKKYLKSFGRYMLFLFLAMVYWWAVLVTFQSDNSLPLLFIMPIVTTIGLFVIRYRQKRARSSP